MADNMIKLIAQLDTKESVSIINKQIERMQNKINPIKIDVKLDDTVKQLKVQLESLAKMPQSNALKAVTEQTQNLGNNVKKVRKELADLNKELSSGSKAYSVGDNGIPKYLDLRGSTEQRKIDAKALIGNSLNDAESQVSRIHIASENAKGVLKDFQVQVEKENGSLEILTYKLTKAGGAYEYVGKKIREATNATSFRSTPIDVQVDLQTERLNAFVSKMEKAGASASQLGIDVEGLKDKLSNVGTDANRMGDFLNSMDLAEKKLSAFNADLQNQKATQRFNSNLQSAQNKLQSFEQAYKRALNSNATMKTLSGQTTTFAAAFDEMRNRVVRSDVELQKLNADMRNFEQQATNTGLKGAGAFDKFAQSFKLISTYISANRIISMITSEIREAVEELKNVDTILTEISKTSNITKENLKQLGKDSFDTASNYGRKASDYLLGVQEFSRAGYNEEQAKSMAELSLKAQAAGDLTAELANEYIIATGAAYELSDKEEELNDVLDRQNYITNRNPVDMEKLATATKLVASQAHASNVEIDEMTAALGTMSAVTQQSGEVSARAFRGVLMNLQQVKASAEDIGDGGEAITAVSLSKYEKATKELGVSLKEVKNGTLQLRKPMEVLKDLSVAVSKEGENSIKVANLISAVGGKYRGNQLLALLKNWDTYEKMLAEYNSNDAIGSAAEEAEKSANNWSGSLNKLRNSWDELINNIVNSERAVTVINSLASGVQALSDSAVLQGINALGDAIFDLGNKASKALDNPFGEFIKFGLKRGVASVSGWGLAFDVGNAEKLKNKIFGDSSDESDNIEELRQAYLDALNKESGETENLISKYTSLANSTSDVSSSEEELIDIQDKLISKYGDENSQLDLLNGNIKENIENISALKKAQNENFLNDNQGVIDSAKATFGVEGLKDKSSISHKSALLNIGDMLDDGELKDEAKTEIKIYMETIKKYLKENYSDIYKNISILGDEKFGEIGFEVKADLSPEEQLKTAQAIVEAYRNAANSRESITRNLDIEAILKSNDVWLKKLTEDFRILEDAEKKQKDQNLWSDFENSNEYEKYTSLIEKAISLNNDLNQGYRTISDDMIAEQKEKAEELQQIQTEIANKNIDITQTVFGNIDTDSRQILEWTDENIEKYRDALDSWGANVKDLAGDISTVFGAYGEYDGVEIAFSPMLQTSDGAVLLNKETVDKYIFKLIEEAGEGWTNEDLLKLDTKGFEIDGRIIKNIIAEIGESAPKVSEAMHYVGDTGALSNLQKEYKKITDEINNPKLTEADRYNIVLELDEVVNELDIIADKYPIVADIIKESLSGIGLAFDTTTESLISAKESWLEVLDDAQKGILANVDKISDAMVKLYSGEAIESKNAWDIINLDSSNILSNIKLDDNGDYIFDLKQIIELKDKILQQEIQQKKETLEELELQKAQVEANLELEERNLARLAAQAAPNSMATNTKHLKEDIERSTAATRSHREALESLNYSIKNYSLYVKECESKLGDLSDTEEVAAAKAKLLDNAIKQLNSYISQLKEELSALNKEADARLKAQEYVLDNIIDGHKKELEALEKEKEALEEQLETLEKQKSETEEIIDNYKTVADVVTSAIEKEIKSIEDERDSVEEYYDEQINKLKKANEEREDAIEYEQKLANLANAQNNKVRVYDQERGWTYETNKEELKKAQDDLKSFETNQQIKDMEKQKEVATQGYDERIKALQDYADQWTEAVNSVTDAENELLAQEILGSDWREKITKQDLITLNKFKTGFTNYNSKLKNLVDTEIASMNKSIEAKDKDIAAKQEQIKAWEDYKSKVQETAKTIKDGLEEYNKYLNDVGVNEKSTTAELQNNLENFAAKYKELIDDIAAQNTKIEESEKALKAFNDEKDRLTQSSGVNVTTNSGSLLGGISGAGATANIGTIINNILEKLHGLENNLFKSIFHYANGGAADYTGLAWVDGTKTASETVFTAAQSKKLLNYVEALPNLGFKVFNGAGLKNSSTSNSQNVTFNGGITVVANNPEQFSDQMNRYIRTKLTQSKVN